MQVESAGTGEQAQQSLGQPRAHRSRVAGLSTVEAVLQRRVRVPCLSLRYCW
jgi:hypothetical protein